MACVNSRLYSFRKLGLYAPGTLKEFLQLTHLSEQYEGGNTSQDYMKLLLADHERIIMFVRGLIKPTEEEYKDAGTADFLTGLMTEHERMAWMLRASIE